MDEITQAELDTIGFLTEVLLTPLTLYRTGRFFAIYKGCHGKVMRRPDEYFNYNLPEGFPTEEYNGIVDSFNQALKEERLESLFFQHIAKVYRLVGRNLPEYVKRCLEDENG